jgi:HEAT repeat protein
MTDEHPPADAASLEALVAQLGSRRWDQRRRAAVALRRLGDPRAVAPLIGCLEDRSAEVRRAVALTLASLGDVAAIEPLTRLLLDREERVRDAAHRALLHLSGSSLPDLLVGMLEQGAEGAPPAALAGLVRLGDPEPLARVLDHPNWAFRRGAVVALGHARALPPLLRAVDDAHPAVRHAAMAALGQLKATAPLLSALADREPGVRRAAVVALASIRGKDAAVLDALARVASTDQAPAVRVSAARVLCRLRSARAVAPLIQALGATDPQVYLAAAAALGRIGAPAGIALGPLEARLKSEPSWRARRHLRQAIRAITLALQNAPAELVTASAPEGVGTEPEAAAAPAGRGTELLSGDGNGVESKPSQKRPWWRFWDD